MKKKLLFSAFFVLGAAFAGCSDDEKPVDPVALAIPVLAEDAVTQVSVAVTWDAVENAVSYACTLDGGAETTVTQPSVRFDGLEPGRSYTVKVKAVAGQEQYLDSEFAQITLTTLPATQLAAPVLSGGRRHGEFRDGRVGSRSRCGILCIYGRWRRGADRYGSVGSRDRAGIRYAGYRACESRFRTGAVPRFRIRRADGRRRHGTESLYAFGCRDRDEQHFRIRISQKQDANLLLWLCPEVRLRQIRFDGGIYRVGAPQTQRFALIAGVSFEEYLATQLVQGDHPFEFTGLKPETDYVVYAVGWYAPGDLLTTVLVSAPATTLPDASGEVTVTFENVASDGFDVVCTPDAAIEKYYVYVLKTSSLPMQVLMAGGLEAFKKEVMPTKDEYTGTQTIRKTGLAAGTSYSVCVLGISKSGSDFWIEATQKTEKAE